MNNSHVESLEPDKLLERYDELNGEIFANGMLQTDELKEELDAIEKHILESLKLANELKSTHAFYLKSGNGHCAGVTNQIIGLSNYGGKLIEFK